MFSIYVALLIIFVLTLFISGEIDYIMDEDNPRKNVMMCSLLFVLIFAGIFGIFVFGRL